MLPRWHIVYGFIFTLIIYFIAPEISLFNIVLIFLSSILIDFDHYVCAVMRTGKFGLKRAFNYHEELWNRQMKEKGKGIRRKGDFHLFHTVEFHALIAIISIFYSPVFYIFIGMIFHSLLDVFSLINKDVIYLREYFFFNWLERKIEKI